MQNIETYLPKEKNYETIGIVMIKYIKTLNPSFYLPAAITTKVNHCSQFPAISDAEFAAAVTPETCQTTPSRCTESSCSRCLLRVLAVARERALAAARIACVAGCASSTRWLLACSARCWQRALRAARCWQRALRAARCCCCACSARLLAACAAGRALLAAGCRCQNFRPPSLRS